MCVSVCLSICIQHRFLEPHFAFCRHFTHTLLKMLSEGILFLRPALPTPSSSRASFGGGGWRGEGRGGDKRERRGGNGWGGGEGRGREGRERRGGRRGEVEDRKGRELRSSGED